MNKKYTVVIYNMDGTSRAIYETKQLKRAFCKAFEEVGSNEKAVVYELHEHMKWIGSEWDYTGTFMNVRLTFGNKNVPTIKEWYEYI